MLRVLHVVPTLQLGGAPKGVLELAGHLASRTELSVSLCVLDGPERTFDFGIPGVEPVHLGYAFDMKNPTRTWRCIRALRRLARERQIHILHSHLMPADFISARAALGSPAAHIAHIRGTPPWLASSRPRDRVRRWLFSHSFRRAATAFVSVSLPAADHLKAGLRLDRADFTVVGNGIDPTRFERMLWEWRGPITRRRAVIGYAGRFCEEKGIRYLLQAAAELIRDGLDLELRLAGSGGLEESLRNEACEHGIAHRVVFLGAVRDMASFYRDLDCVVLPSLEAEGLPRVVIEAMFCARPVIATALPGLSDVVTQDATGILVAPGSSAALAAAIRRLVTDESLARRLSANGRSVSHRFTVEAVADRVMSVYAATRLRSRQ